ncbi:unnamed protein product, partial [Medioppia subpectinata]
AIGCVTAELQRGEALWPGKSDVDQLYLIRKTVGDLMPRHMTVFKTNEFFAGVTLPEPETHEPLESKIPKQIEESGMDFLRKCLDKDPQKRPVCDVLLRHPYFINVKIPEIESTAEDTNHTKFRQRSKYGQSILPTLTGKSGTPDIRSVQLHSRTVNNNNNNINRNIGPIHQNSLDRNDNYGLIRTTRFEHLPNI